MPLPLLEIALPVGISFYTFMTVSYVIDVYRRETEPLSNYYRNTGILVAVDSSPGMDEVFAEIERVLDGVK